MNRSTTNSTDRPPSLNWYVLYTKPRHEKKVSEKLSEIGIENYCPLQKVQRQWSDRVKTVEEPLFKSYLFVKIDNSIRDSVFQIKGVVRYLFWLGKPAIVREEEILTIQKWMNEYDHSLISIESNKAIRQDDTIELNSGILSGEKAKVVTRSGNILTLNLKGMGVFVKVNLRNTLVKKVLDVK